MTYEDIQRIKNTAEETRLQLKFTNNVALREFMITIPRLSNHEEVKSNHVVSQLTKQQEDICNFCSVPRTSQEIMDRLGISNQSRNRQKYIAPLVEMGVLQLTNPDSPKANNQKYRKASQ